MAVKVSSDHRAQIAEAEKKLDLARNAVIDLEKKNRSLVSRIDVLISQSSSLRDDLESERLSSSRKIVLLEQRVKDFQTQVDEYENEVRYMAEEKARADEAEAQIVAITEKYEAEISSLRSDLKALQVKLYEFRLAAEKIL